MWLHFYYLQIMAIFFPGKLCKSLGSKSKDMPRGQCHFIHTIQAEDCGDSFCWMRMGCIKKKKKKSSQNANGEN